MTTPAEEVAFVDWSDWLREVGDFTMVPNALVQHSGLSNGAFHVLLVILSHRNRKSGDCMPSRPLLAEEMEHTVERAGGESSSRRRPSLDQIDRYKLELQREGYLDWERRAGKNWYTVRIPPRVVARMRERPTVEAKVDPETKRAAPKRAAIDGLMDHFRGVHLERTGDEYVPNQGRDRKVIADLLDTFSADDIRNLVLGVFLIDDAWVKEQGYSWPILKTKLPKIQAKIRSVVASRTGTAAVVDGQHTKHVEEAKRGGANVDEEGLVRIGRTP